MKKKVKSVEELQRLALARGAAVKVGDRHFNTTRAKVAPKPAPRPGAGGA
jgi:hypothetical protein